MRCLPCLLYQNGRELSDCDKNCKNECDQRYKSGRRIFLEQEMMLFHPKQKLRQRRLNVRALVGFCLRNAAASSQADGPCQNLVSSLDALAVENKYSANKYLQ